MKQPRARKLSIHRETVKQLSRARLTEVVGGSALTVDGGGRNSGYRCPSGVSCGCEE